MNGSYILGPPEPLFLSLVDHQFWDQVVFGGFKDLPPILCQCIGDFGAGFGFQLKNLDNWWVSLEVYFQGPKVLCISLKTCEWSIQLPCLQPNSPLPGGILLSVTIQIISILPVLLYWGLENESPQHEWSKLWLLYCLSSPGCASVLSIS